eukprot:gb/GEZN01003361.1/.p1 GENE.gb/GEZN01003361.1/~~gb/GEZN01003361.1/.p1  ORF type:complete len:590 (+),score=104.73 gb/GEZN01003361.1/:319-2088(+)
MSFFDDVESTIADTRILQALRDDARVELKLQPYEELGDYEATYRKKFDSLDVFTVETVRYYEFKRFLQAEGLGDWTDLLEKADAYATELLDQRVALAQVIFETWVRNLDSATDPSLNNRSNGGVTNGGEDAEGGVKKEELSPDRVRWCLKQKIPAAVIETIPKRLKNSPRDLFLALRDAACEELRSRIPAFKRSEMWKRLVQVESYATKKVGPLDFFEFRVVGRGAFGAVSAVQKKDTQATYAMKEMNKRQVKSRKSEWIVNGEKSILSAMDSVFVLSLMYAFHDENSLFFIFELCPGGDLNYHLVNQEDTKRFGLVRSRFYAAETLLGLEHIHSRGFVYRDLKPHNLLLDRMGHVKISDLGLALKLQKNKILKQLAGTAGYWAPEILSKTGTYTTSDIWSFGVFLYRMLAGRRPHCRCKQGDFEWCPFGNSPHMEKNAQSEYGVLTYFVNYPTKYFSPEAKDLLSKIFVTDPRQRLGAGGYDEIYQHPFFKEIDWEKLRDKALTPPFRPQEYSNWRSIAEVGTMDVKKFKKMKLDEKDNANYAEFYYVNDKGYQAELAKALAKMDSPDSRDAQKNFSDNGCAGCCTVL